MDKLVKKYYALSPLDQKRPVEIRPRNRYNGASTPDATSGRTERPTPIYKRQALAYGVASWIETVNRSHLAQYTHQHTVDIVRLRRTRIDMLLLNGQIKTENRVKYWEYVPHVYTDRGKRESNIKTRHPSVPYLGNSTSSSLPTY